LVLVALLHSSRHAEKMFCGRLRGILGAVSETRTFRQAWPVWRFVALAVLALSVGWLAWHLHSLSYLGFWIALIVLNVVQLVWDWRRLPR
jgi:hypothetical protein